MDVSNSQIRVAITGGGGWLGRELISRFVSSNENLELLPLGTHERDVNIGSASYRVFDWDESILEDWQPTHLVHLACRTREQIIADPRMGEFENSQILNRLLMGMRLPSLRGVLLASSGAALSDPPDSYGRHKLEEEVAVTSLALEMGIDCVVGRIWSVSGRFCTKPGNFLFYDLLRQAKDTDSSEIHLTGPRSVSRRYVDGGEFLSSCFTSLTRGNTAVYNSGGELVTSPELAEMVIKRFAPHKVLKFSHIDGQVDSYATEVDESIVLEHAAGMSFSPISVQIERSAKAILGN